MSSCNDLVTSDGAGTNIISGHFDRRIRFWDTRYVVYVDKCFILEVDRILEKLETLILIACISCWYMVIFQNEGLNKDIQSTTVDSRQSATVRSRSRIFLKRGGAQIKD